MKIELEKIIAVIMEIDCDFGLYVEVADFTPDEDWSGTEYMLINGEEQRVVCICQSDDDFAIYGYETDKLSEANYLICSAGRGDNSLSDFLDNILDQPQSEWRDNHAQTHGWVV